MWCQPWRTIRACQRPVFRVTGIDRELASSSPERTVCIRDTGSSGTNVEPELESSRSKKSWQLVASVGASVEAPHCGFLFPLGVQFHNSVSVHPVCLDRPALRCPSEQDRGGLWARKACKSWGARGCMGTPVWIAGRDVGAWSGLGMDMAGLVSWKR